MQSCRKLIKTAMALSLIGTTAVPSAIAQNGRSGSNSGQAVLHIRVQVAPTVLTTPVQPKTQVGVVTYSVPTVQRSMDVIEEVHPLTGIGIRSNVGIQGA